MSISVKLAANQLVHTSSILRIHQLYIQHCSFQMFIGWGYGLYENINHHSYSQIRSERNSERNCFDRNGIPLRSGLRTGVIISNLPNKLPSSGSIWSSVHRISSVLDGIFTALLFSLLRHDAIFTFSN